MDRPLGREPSPKLAELLIRIQRDMGSLNKVASAAGIAPGSISRAARGDGGLHRQSALRLEARFGRKYGFTANDIMAWSVLDEDTAEDDEVAMLDAILDDPSLRAASRVALQTMTPEERTLMLRHIREAFELYLLRETQDRGTQT